MVPTGGNYPTLKKGNSFFATNLLKPRPFDFVTYYTSAEGHEGELWVQRLCGMPGDKLEIIAGDLYVNDKMVDRGLTLAHNYIVSQNVLSNIDKEVYDEEAVNVYTVDSILVALPDKYVLENKLPARRYIIPNDEPQEFLNEIFNKQWNQDYFGPVTVPEGKYFMLGDNRLHSQDSRFIGYIDEKDIAGVVIGK